MTKPITIVIIDDHAIFRLGLAQAFAGSSTIRVVAQGGSVAEAVSLVGQYRPDVLLLDLWMQRRSSVGDVPEILAASPLTKIVVLTALEDSQDVVTVMSAGAAGFISKDTAADQLVSIIQSIQDGETYLSSQSLAGWLAAFKQTSRVDADRKLASDLSPHELAVLRAISSGSNNKEAADQLGISTATIKYHLARIFVKLGVRNRVEAAMVARRLLDESRKS